MDANQHISMEEYKTISGAWEKSAAADSAEPNSKAILQRLRLLFLLRQHWRTPSFFHAPRFGMRQCFSMRQGFGMHQCFSVRQGFGMRQCFVCTKVLACANVFVHFCQRLYFCVFYWHQYFGFI
jgi:hypothetical protein